MFKNVGKKIKALAKGIFIIEIIISLVISVWGFIETVNILEADDVYTLSMTICILLFIFIFLFSVFISWISALFIYGKGELIEKTSEIAKNTANTEIKEECSEISE